MIKMEIRNNDFKLSSKGHLVVQGYANKTEQASEVLGTTKKFKEKIAKGAFSKAIQKSNRAIDFLAEHNEKLVLASTRNGSLELLEDEQGLFMSATIAPTSWGKDYYELIKSGLIQSMSFGFRSIRDSWENINGFAVRTVHELELFEVSAVKNPAYSQSTISARGIELIEEIDVPIVQEQLEKRKEEKLMMEVLEKRNTEFEGFVRGTVEARGLQMNSEGTGALVPDQVHNDIVLKMEEVSPVFAMVRKIPSVSGHLKVAREDEVGIAGFVGEGVNVLEGAINFDEVKLDQKRVGAAIALSNQLVNDAAVNLVDYSTNLLARRAVKAIEKSIIAGIAEEEFRGIIHDVDIKQVDTNGVVTIDDLLDLYLQVHPEFLTNASFLMHRDFFNHVAKLKDGNGHFYLQNGIINGKLTYTLFGAQVYVTDALTYKDGLGTPVLFGNFEEAYSLMVKKDFALQHITSDTTQALRGSRLLVFDAYMDGAVVNPQAIAKMVVA